MKNLVFVLIVSCCMFWAHVVLAQGSSALLEINNVSARITTNGSYFNANPFSSGFKTPRNNNPGGVGTIANAAWWIGAYGHDDTLKLKADEYDGTFTEFVAGPLNVSASERPAWDKIWKVTRSDIESFLYDIQNNGTIDQPIPASILNWPARGNLNVIGNASQPIMVYNSAAPFNDVNGNGIYDPLNDGDYPKIKGDEMLWFVYNDSVIGDSGEQPLGFEFQVSVYAYYEASFQSLNNTVFVDMKLHSHSPYTYDSLYLGHFVDFDIGCFNNDYVGCDPNRNMFYGYNASSIDPDCANDGYYEDPPLQSVRFLGQDLSGFMTFNNDYSLNGIPENKVNYYNYMKCIWKDNSCLTDDQCNGYGSLTACTNYYAPDEPSITTSFPVNWSEMSCNSTPSDRRGVGSIGPLSVEPGTYIEFTAVYTAHDSVWVNGVPSRQLVRSQSDSVIAHMFADTLLNDYTNPYPILPGIADAERSLHVDIYPNPNNGVFNLEVANAYNLDIEIFNIVGELVVPAQQIKSFSTTIDLSHLQDGIYLVKVGSQVLRVVKHQ